ncbi:MAG: hypothetical protein RDV48_13155 [Candidatus Eremiobacteraeota bacterium]|nr:hypothetical protein [Candidatus Eremiobacteraeota bacterium]
MKRKTGNSGRNRRNGREGPYPLLFPHGMEHPGRLCPKAEFLSKKPFVHGKNGVKYISDLKDILQEIAGPGGILSFKLQGTYCKISPQAKTPYNVTRMM